MAISKLTPLISITLAGLVVIGISLGQERSAAGVPLRGLVTSSDGKPMEGVAVSARADGKLFTTTVYSDRNGAYSFSPLDDGQYKLWAQAVGFEAARASFKISSGKTVDQNVSLKATPNFQEQMSTPDWIASLPDVTPEDHRLRRILNVNCNTCHQLGMVLRNRFDEAGWTAILNFMERTGGEGGQGALLPYIHAYKDEIVKYLTRVRGPGSPELKYKISPRPSGESTQIVVTEYDIPPGSQPGVPVFDNGSDWSMGMPSHYESRSPHDVVVDANGIAWFTDQATPKRTIGKLDPKTGKVTDYTYYDKNKIPMATHDIVLDAAGNVWTVVSPFAPKQGRRTGDGFFVKFDPKTEKFQAFPVPRSLPPVGSGFDSIDSKGNLWASVSGGSVQAPEGDETSYERPKVDNEHPGGAIKLDPKTGEYTFYKALHPAASYYGVQVDAHDNAWFTHPGWDRFGFVDATTGKVSEFKSPALNPDDLSRTYTERDREISKFEAGPQVGPLWQLGTRRGAADKKSNVVWYDAAQGNRILKIDIDTKKITQYPMPLEYSFPYAMAVDKNHMVWVSASATDEIFKFNPVTEKFTSYPLPTRGTDARYVYADHSTEQPTIWVAYFGASKLARIQFRAASR